ncbi:YqaE/Pmp3 family membrane protein [Maricaulis sp.]|uniref:YqaE/Pmp3 family membrane protein n=1 Tax=Maricaulis sp. TaxID=1486257 RepID=UPI001B2938D4|nr:YqaE/Pmp3 family membrane protein [Maricaulis sp.]MBO6764784.1 YqaE/Pmp3 family membrane protein [Maricaulis sp.]|tara:strand:- start:1124 stop:1309 length:186 start_codon:yes stop_codon:yes gene_type:complete
MAQEQTVTGGDILRIIAAILLPPLGVFLQVGIGAQFWINIILTILGYIPGIVHAVWIIARR